MVSWEITCIKKIGNWQLSTADVYVNIKYSIDYLRKIDNWEENYKHRPKDDRGQNAENRFRNSG